MIVGPQAPTTKDTDEQEREVDGHPFQVGGHVIFNN